MGSCYSHHCDHCGYSVTTSGPWEFYRDANGQRKPYGHPIPMSREGRERGIAGLAAALYCLKCDKVFDLVIVEFKQPARDSLSVWSGAAEPQEAFKREGAVKCPDCGDTRLLLEGDKSTEKLCPRCKGGTLNSRREWIS